jgi:hypothetical protein
MHSRVRCFGFAALLAPVACSLTLAASGCGGKEPTRAQTIERYSLELREAVSTNVPDEGRKAQMLSIVDQVEALNHRFNQGTADFIASYRKLNADYDAMRPAFDQLFSDYNAMRIKTRDEALGLHFQLAALATADEWKSIGKAEVKLYKKVDEVRPAEESTK